MNKSMGEKLADKGYKANEKVSKIMELFRLEGLNNKKKKISAMLLEGNAGVGKTFLAETFAEMVDAKNLFLQCFPGMNSDNLMTEPNIPAILKNDSNNAINEGILIKSIKHSSIGPTVLILDEIDKCSPEVDSFLLDFLNSGRLTDGQHEWRKGNCPIWVFLTSNGDRNISDALRNRCRNLYIDRPSKKDFLEVLGVDEEDPIALIYDKFPEFSIRQAKSYLRDLKVLEKDFDIDVLSQYVNLSEMKVSTLEELERLGDFEGELINYPLIDLARTNNKDLCLYLRDTTKKYNIITEGKSLCVIAKTLEELLELRMFCKYLAFSGDVEIPEKFIKKLIKSENKKGANCALIFLNDDFMVQGIVTEGKVYCNLNNYVLDDYIQSEGLKGYE